ncbi:MAG TPA: serine/threonine-protein kinase [Kofleriaceae bacterium]|jgi:serine/threonine protein kinase
MSETATIGGRYALDGRLGEGGMGQVYRARHLQLGKAFALKIISPAFATDNSARQRFNEEAKLASEISHPNIVGVVDFGEDATFGAYMVMELVDGEPLINESSGAMSVRRACDILSQIADALDHIHRRGIVHGDVKADNVMLTAELGAAAEGARRRRIARLLDFGLARRSDGEEDGEVNGSPHYIAPERASGGPPSVAADVYALGVLAYLLVTGRLPFEGNVVELLMSHIEEPPVAPSLRRTFDEHEMAMEPLIMRALAKDPSHRHASAGAFRAELNTVMDLLDMGRRRRNSGQIAVETPRETSIVSAFERSTVPQALMSLDGRIELANNAFARLCGIDGDATGLMFSATTLAGVVPGIQRVLKAAHNDGKPHERRARIFRGADRPALELVLWFCPVAIAGTEIHLMIRSDEEDPRRRARESGGY